MSADVQLMSRSFVVEEAFPPVPFEAVRDNATARGYSAFHRPSNRGDGPFGSFLSWLRGVGSVGETGFLCVGALRLTLWLSAFVIALSPVTA